MRTVAFLDVDHTLLFDSSDSLNVTLLNALLAHDITCVYLFTDMTFSQHTVEERNGLMKRLEEMGFSVQGAITPNDITWAKMDASEVNILHDMCFQQRTYSGKFFGAEFETFILEHTSTLINLSEAVQFYDPDSALPSEAYSDACLELHSTRTISDSTKMKSIFAKVFADHLSEKYGYKHNKGLLLDMFLRHKPDWVDGIIVFDDNKDVIEDVSHFKPVNLVETSTGHPNASQFPLVLVSMVPVTSSAHTSDYYDRLISKHLENFDVHTTDTVINTYINYVTQRVVNSL